MQCIRKIRLAPFSSWHLLVYPVFFMGSKRHSLDAIEQINVESTTSSAFSGTTTLKGLPQWPHWHAVVQVSSWREQINTACNLPFVSQFGHSTFFNFCCTLEISNVNSFVFMFCSKMRSLTYNNFSFNVYFFYLFYLNAF